MPSDQIHKVSIENQTHVEYTKKTPEVLPLDGHLSFPKIFTLTDLIKSTYTEHGDSATAPSKGYS